MNQDLSWPKEYKKLFVQEGDYYEFSHFGWGSEQTQFYGYIKGYKDAADLLIKNAINSKDVSVLDTSVFPVLFLYRQFIELSLKQAIIVFSEGDRNSVAKKIIKISHDLSDAWIEYESIMTKSMNATERETLLVVGKYISDFHEIDKGSFNFRYPITKKLELVFGSDKRINLRLLKGIIDEISNYFNGSLDYMAEQLSNE